jgi:predicted phosphodiesterase
MKIAVLSDIHSNVFALEAVIADVKKRSVDLMINLGDILYGPIAPKATYDLLMQHDIVTICGNQDRQIFEAKAEEITSNRTMQFIIDNLGAEPIAWMASLPFDLQLTDDIYLCHGTPNNDLIYLLENVELGYARLRSDSEIIKLLNGQESEIILCGHTHTPRTVSLTTGQMIINPGSVGLQAYTDDEPTFHSMENFNSMASYSVVNKTLAGCTVEHIKVPYDVNLAVIESKKRDRNDWAHFLTTGRRV